MVPGVPPPSARAPAPLAETNVIRTRILALVLASTLVSTASIGVSHAEVIERVVAVVNDDAIFLSDMRQKAAPYLARAMQAPTEGQRMEAIRQIYTQVLERMIDERLILQVADEEDVTVSTSDVSEAITNVRTQSGLGETEFWGAVQAQGFTPEQYRRDVRQQLLRLKVLNQRVRARVNITEEDVRRRYEESAARTRRTSMFEACYVRFALGAEASATEIHRAMQGAQAIRDRIASLSDFELAMEEHGGSCTGRISEGDVDPTLGEALSQLDEGDTSDPIRTDGGVFLLHLMSRDSGASDLQAYEAVRMDLYREMMQEAMTRQEELFLQELRRRAVIDRRLEL